MTAVAGIRAEGLARAFGGVRAVDGVSLAVEAGGVTGILGPNGSGKSTFLRMLLGLVRPDAGTAEVAGVRLAGDGTAVRRRATFAPGEIALYGEMRGGEHLDWLGRGRTAEDRRRARELAARLGLPLAKRVHTYSHGMKRQLLFASAMGPDVPVRVLDEPTEGLDPSKRREVLAMMEEARAAGSTVLLSSHHLQEVEQACDRIVFFHRGLLLADETPESLDRRARRSVQVGFEAPAAATAAGVALGGSPELAGLAVDGTVLRLVLAGDDPRPFLARLAALGGEPPRSVEVGRIGLADLYRDVYGVEGL